VVAARRGGRGTTRRVGAARSGAALQGVKARRWSLASQHIEAAERARKEVTSSWRRPQHRRQWRAPAAQAGGGEGRWRRWRGRKSALLHAASRCRARSSATFNLATAYTLVSAYTLISAYTFISTYTQASTLIFAYTLISTYTQACTPISACTL
jgi:hypothetical protein